MSRFEGIEEIQKKTWLPSRKKLEGRHMMALYLLPNHKTVTEHVSYKKPKHGFSKTNALAMSDLGKAKSAVLFAEAPLTKWYSIEGITRWL
jgi:hypothetical protein